MFNPDRDGKKSVASNPILSFGSKPLNIDVSSSSDDETGNFNLQGNKTGTLSTMN